MTESVSNRVFTLRQASGDTQEQLADAVGVSRQTIIAIERGNYSPSVALALRLARHFNIDVESIFILHTS